MPCFIEPAYQHKKHINFNGILTPDALFPTRRAPTTGTSTFAGVPESATALGTLIRTGNAQGAAMATAPGSLVMRSVAGGGA